MKNKTSETAQIVFENKSGEKIHQYKIPVAIPTWRTSWVENTMKRAANQFLKKTGADVLVVLEREDIREPILLLEELDGTPFTQVDPRNELEQLGLQRFLETGSKNSLTQSVRYRPSITEMLRAQRVQFKHLFSSG